MILIELYLMRMEILYQVDTINHEKSPCVEHPPC